MTPSSVKHTTLHHVASSGKKSSGLGYISEDEAQQEEDDSQVVIDEEEDESESESDSEPHPAAFSEVKESSVEIERSVSSDKRIPTPVLKTTSPVVKSKPATAKKASVTKSVAKPSAKKNATK